jgi:hypothetical protein
MEANFDRRLAERVSRRDLLLEQRQDFFLVLKDRIQAALILKDRRLVFLDGFLVGPNLTLVGEDGFLVLQNLLLIADYVLFGHGAVSSLRALIIHTARYSGGDSLAVRSTCCARSKISSMVAV